MEKQPVGLKLDQYFTKEEFISKVARKLHPWNTDGDKSLFSLIFDIFLNNLCGMFRNSTNKI